MRSLYLILKDGENMPKCDICGKNTGFIQGHIMKADGKVERSTICMDCAKKLNLLPFDAMMKQMTISEDELRDISKQIMSYIENADPEEYENSALFKAMNPDELVVDGEEAGKEDEGGDGDGMNPFSRLIKLSDFSSPLMDVEEGPLYMNEIGDYSMDAPGFSSGVKADSKPRKKNLKNLDKYSENLNELALSGKIDAVIGREKEIERMVQVLARRRKNNPCLVGEAGVGKTAVCQGLALRIVEGRVPAKLKDKVIYQLDLVSLVAGTQYRGQFESRMKAVINEAKEAGNVILVIDEIHTVVGLGEVEGGTMNAGNILKPVLANGDIQLIGTTTLDEYSKHIEKDSALERRFQKVLLEEPSEADSIEILKGIKHYYEKFHMVKISEEICETAVKLAVRYINDRFLPDKAIDLIDEACAMVNLKNIDLSEFAELNNELMDIITKKEEASEKDDFEAAAMYKQKELKLRKDLEDLERKMDGFELGEMDLRRVLELWTGIPVGEIDLEEKDRLLGLETSLRARVIGQEEALASVSRAVRRARAGFKKAKKPASFLFVGPTGVGKTELSKALAKELFGDETAIIRLDMSEYMEKHTVSKLVGAPPGYVGFDDGGGRLTDRIRRRPYSIVLLDEIEKAHPDVLNSMLQVIDDGRLTDSKGRIAHFEHSVIIMTSNAGTSFKNASLGFHSDANNQLRNKVGAALKENFRPEFLGRIDEIVIFNALSEEDMSKIVDIELARVEKDLRDKKISLSMSAEAKKEVLKQGFDPSYGARPLKKCVQKLIEDEIAELYLRGELEGARAISVDAEGDAGAGRLKFSVLLDSN